MQLRLVNQKHATSSEASRNRCLVCSVDVSADNKAPIPQLCFSCWESQEDILQKIADSKLDAQPAIASEPKPSETSAASKPGPADMELSGCKAAADSAPEPEVEGSKASVDVCCAVGALDAYKEEDGDDPGFFELPKDYSVLELKKEYKDVSKNASVIASQDQRRWELYAKVALLVQAGQIASAVKAEEELKKLKINRLKLGKILTMLKKDGGLPREAPAEFRIGASPATSLTEREKLDLLAVIRFHARCSLPLSSQDVSRTIVAWKPISFSPSHPCPADSL